MGEELDEPGGRTSGVARVVSRVRSSSGSIRGRLACEVVGRSGRFRAVVELRIEMSPGSGQSGVVIRLRSTSSSKRGNPSASDAPARGNARNSAAGRSLADENSRDTVPYDEPPRQHSGAVVTISLSGHGDDP